MGVKYTLLPLPLQGTPGSGPHGVCMHSGRPGGDGASSACVKSLERSKSAFRRGGQKKEVCSRSLCRGHSILSFSPPRWSPQGVLTVFHRFQLIHPYGVGVLWKQCALDGCKQPWVQCHFYKEENTTHTSPPRLEVKSSHGKCTASGRCVINVHGFLLTLCW